MALESLLLSVEQAFAGPLVQNIEGFAARPEQVEMARGVARTLMHRSTLLAEAGTGTGKTFAYSVPALLSGQRVVISTATKTLQEQIALRDLPRLIEALGLSDVRVSMLKGRQNYLCLHRLDRAQKQPTFRFRGSDAALVQIGEWATRTQTGDRAELSSLPDDYAPWRDVDARGDTCLGSACHVYDECFVTRARQRAGASDIIVVNHHLFFADLRLRQRPEIDSPVLPRYDAVIFDEAHAIEDVATEHFGITLSEARLLDWAKDADEALVEHAPASRQSLALHLADLPEQLDALFAQLGLTNLGGGTERRLMPEVQRHSEVLSLAARLEQSLSAAADALKEAGREPIWNVLAERAERLARETAFLFLPEQPTSQDADEPPRFAKIIEERARSRLIRALPLSVASMVGGHLFADQTASVLTSATMSIAGNFETFRRRLGLEAAEEIVVPSPFDYPRQAQFFVPSQFPEPNDPAFAQALQHMLEALCTSADGGAFFLFTSLRMMNLQADALRERLSSRWLVLKQGEAPKSVLLERFVQHGSAVLFASHSFWEGVDVPGAALRLVVIDKLPFASPGDPLLAARLAEAERQGESGFETLQLSSAILALRQGFGRLIRSPHDRGVVALTDIRVRKKGYGRKFIKALPPAPVTGDLAQVQRFFAQQAVTLGS